MKIVPCTLREARAFVVQHHRHQRPSQGLRWEASRG